MQKEGYKLVVTLLAGESYTCIKWLLSGPLTSCGLPPQFVHLNDIPECVWMALVRAQGLSFQRHANVSFAPLSGSLLTARATAKEMIGTLQPPSPPEYSHISNNTYSTSPNKERRGKKSIRDATAFVPYLLKVLLKLQICFLKR